MSIYSPFSKSQLLPQEEKLEVARHKSELFIGIPKETSYQERRICLTPDAVSSLVSHGHRVMLEAGAGESSSYTDKEYSDAGAEITQDTKKVLGCPMILKVEPPTLSEIEMMNAQTIVISAIQLKTQKKEYFEALANKRITALAFEFIKDEDGSYPAVKSLSEIAGTASILIASNYASTQKEIIDNPKLSKYMQIIINQSNKLNQHIEKILYVAKTESKQIELEKSKVDLKVLLELVRENIFLKHQKEIKIDIQLDRNYFIQADEFHFYNVIYNILDNAVKYATQNPEIIIRTKENSKGLTLKFSDNGVGIPENDLPFIFDKFYRVTREDSKDTEGFGIGLSYVKRVCEWHKWKVDVKNNEENGITITIQINKNDYE